MTRWRFYLLKSIAETCKAAVQRMKCPNQVWNTLKTTFKAVSEAAIDAELTHQQTLSLEKGEKVVGYNNQLKGMVNELDSAGHALSDIHQKKRTFPRHFCRV